MAGADQVPGSRLQAARYAQTGKSRQRKMIWRPAIRSWPVNGIPQGTEASPRMRWRRGPAGESGGSAKRATSGRHPWHPEPREGLGARYVPEKRSSREKTIFKVSIRTSPPNGIRSGTDSSNRITSRPVPTGRSGGGASGDTPIRRQWRPAP